MPPDGICTGQWLLGVVFRGRAVCRGLHCDFDTVDCSHPTLLEDSAEAMLLALLMAVSHGMLLLPVLCCVLGPMAFGAWIEYSV